MRQLRHLLVATICLLAPVMPAVAQSVTLVNLTADWCPNCQVLDPRLDAAMDKVDPNEVARLELDFTDNDTRTEAYERVNGTLMANPYADFLGVTGLGILVASDSGETIECLTAAMTEEVILGRIAAAIDTAKSKPVGKRDMGSFFCPSRNSGVRVD